MPPAPPSRPSPLPVVAATGLIAVLTVLFCLIPKPENDLFFELRIGRDILNTGRLPHFDTYSWTNSGTHWDVPEWLSFVTYALAYRTAGFFGTWLLMAVLAVATALTVWFWLVRRAGVAWAFPLTCLGLLALSGLLQERPYAFTYLLLPVCLILVTRAREGRPRLLLWLPPLCAVWTNFHQGVVVLIGLLLTYALGDILTMACRQAQAEPPDLLTPEGREREAAERTAHQGHRAAAGRTLLTAVACALAAMLSPYGWRVYWNVFITLRDRSLMANVTEWNPATTLPWNQLQPFLVLAVIVFGALILGRRRTLAEVLAVSALFAEGWLHARNVPLFALGGLVIAGPHLRDAGREVQRRLGLSPRPALRRGSLIAGTLLFTGATALLSLTHLRREIGPRGYSAQGIGTAVIQKSDYPDAACEFMEAERFPPHLRLLNGFETGGFLMWRLPNQPVFVDGRLDVYVGRTFDDMVTLSRHPGSPAWAALVRRYDFDAVLTTRASEARAFAALPDWQLVYENANAPHARLLLHRRPQFTALIARCLRDRPL